ncbi:MAG: hypothetical protein WD851_01070 [Pirellulales bacterium]
MANGLEHFAAFLKKSGGERGEFRAEPYYESETDSLIFYTRDVPTYSKRITRYLTLFLSSEDESFAGIEIKGLKTTLIPALEGMESVRVASPLEIKDEDGETVYLEVAARVALGDTYIEPLDGPNFEQINKATRNVKVHLPKGQLCTN